MKYLAGFIGAGNMGGALATAAAKNSDKITVADFFADKAAELAEKIGASATTNADIIENSKYIFLGVKPQMLKGLFSEIAPLLKKREDGFILVSMAAGTSIEEIHQLSCGDYPIIRIMPNTPAAVGSGTVLYCYNGLVKNTDEFTDLLKCAGTVDEIPEHLIDAASAITGCGPAWIYMFIESLADGGVECGLPRAKALSYACDTLIGSARLVKETGMHPGQLKDNVCSPAGTTIAGLHALESRGFRGTVIDAVTAAYDKTVNLKK